MPPIVVDLVLAALILGMTYALMSEGLWGSALMFFNVLFSAVLALNFYEPLAKLLASNMSFIAGFADSLCLMAIFIVSLVIFRLTTETLAPAMVRFPTPVYHVGRIAFALAGSTVTLAMILLAFHCAPVHKKVFSVVDYKYAPPFKLGIDRGLLGFFQYTTGYIFPNYGGTPDPSREFGTARAFDPRGEWLLLHQDARPYGTETVLGTESSGGGAEGGGGGEGGASADAGGGGSRPGDIKVIGPAVGGGVVVPN
ncbi:MAG: hypothetical protein U0794_08080 [Isosphaeraceae bacterium]